MNLTGNGFEPDMDQAFEEIARLRATLDVFKCSMPIFVHSFIHEVKNPINTARLHLEVLMSCFTSDDEQESILGPKHMQRNIRIAVQSCERVEALCMGSGRYLRMLCRVMDTDNLVSRQKVNAAKALQTVLIDEVISKSGIHLSMAEIPCVLADESDLQEMFREFLKNAIANRRNDQVQVSVAAKVENGECIIAVQDNGIGFDPDDSENVFRPWWSTSKNPEAAGMGLAICRLRAAVNGWRVWARSRPGEGATLYLALPVSES
jgi:signal transduction histidine kinase